ncbi:cell division protein SepF [Bacillota bacterium LX-D]|nr:cell division protein SepF [Bacillota bacterium LX-D]
MGKFVDKVLGFMGFEAEEVEDAVVREEPSAWNERKEKNSKNNIVSLPAPKPMKMVLVKPTAFEQVQGIADHLKGRKPVIVNLEEADREIAKRIIDFLSGTTYALGGSMQKINAAIMLFVPSNVDVSGEIGSIMDKGIFNLTKC